MNRYGLARGVRLVHDPVQRTDALLYPEGVLLLNETAADIVRLCDGTRTSLEIATTLSARYDGVTEESVADVVTGLARRRLLVQGATAHPVRIEPAAGNGDTPRDPVPLGVLAELTYRCPLRCTYCANPVSLSAYAAELSTDDWLRVFDQARALGVLQVHLSGGEPLLRNDLADLIWHAHVLGMYTNLITSGIPLTEARFAILREAGLDHLQLSIQDVEPSNAKAITGVDAHERKLKAAKMIRRSDLPLTVNVVLHQGNISRLTAIAELAMALGADRLELAHTQYYGWAWRNRAALTPSPAQVASAADAVYDLRQRFGAAVEIVYVQPDYHTGSPKPCMNGWGSRQLVVAPNGDVLPCLAAAQLPGLPIANVRTEALRTIWHDSPAFNRFRGTDWLPEPCQSCALRDIDFGGCRCQAYQVTGDPATTDPACRLSPHHHLLTSLVAQRPAAAVFRRFS
jgi:pyrroloquinoline quinone biosynthesis protein E